MNGNFIERDVMFVSGWSAGVEYPPGGMYGSSYKQLTPEETYFRDKAVFEVNKPELMICSIPGPTGHYDQVSKFQTIIEKDGWKEAGWYPTIHDNYLRGYGVHVFFKLNKEGKLFDIKTSYRWTNNMGGLGCSVGIFTGKPPLKVGRASDYNGGSYGINNGQKRLSIWRWDLSNGPTQGVFKQSGYYKFATTSLAKYFIYALKPGEDRGTVEK